MNSLVIVVVVFVDGVAAAAAARAVLCNPSQGGPSFLASAAHVELAGDAALTATYLLHCGAFDL